MLQHFCAQPVAHVWPPCCKMLKGGAKALMKQRCTHVAKRVQHHADPKMLHEKFGNFQI